MGEPIYGLIGRTLAHSFSDMIHGELGNSHYRLIELAPEALKLFFKENDIAGLNVTIPYKKSVMSYCAMLSAEALAIGSVNTIVPAPQGLRGHNTDAYGLAWMARQAGISFSEKKALIFGSGGASLAAQYVAKQAGARTVVILSRSGKDNYGTLSRHEDAEILINATPVGMYPEAGRSIVDIARFPRCQGVLDMVYNPLRTALLMQAEAHSIPCSGGLPMLVAQAKAAEELFFEQNIPDGEITRILRLLYTQKENIILIGMPGSGKTTVGAALAAITGRELIDLDEKIAEAVGKPIPALIKSLGEEAFRNLESGQAAIYGAMHGKILATGGGIVKRAENYYSLRQNGRIYHIIRETCLLEREGRPLSMGADLAQMYRDRLPLYTRFRDTAIENNTTPMIAAEWIWRDYCEYTGG